MANLLRTLKLVHVSSYGKQCRNIGLLCTRKGVCFVTSSFQRNGVSDLRLNCRRDFTQAHSHTSRLRVLLCFGQRQRLFTSDSNGHRESSSLDKTDKKLPKIYTRTGDKGTSVTIAGDRRPKNDLVFEALGATDELSSHIGLAREFIQESKLTSCNLQLEEIQCVLQDAGSNIATPKSLASKNQLQMTEFNGATVEMLEAWIDEMTASLPPLRNFILPSGGKSSSALHVARSVCRRAERSIAPLATSDEIDPAVAKFINRLSDYLFTAARFVAQEEGKAETIYRRVKPKDKK